MLELVRVVRKSDLLSTKTTLGGSWGTLFIQETRCRITLFDVNLETTGSHKRRISCFISYNFQETFHRDELRNIFSLLHLSRIGKTNGEQYERWDL